MKRLRENQNGMAALVIAVIICMILLTIVIGFSKLVRREQRRSLDRQLSSQAFYAAETGINDAKKAVNDGYTGTKTRCTPFAADPSIPASITGNSNRLTPDGSVSYSCLLINPNPDLLKFDNIKTGASTIFPLQPSNGASIGSVTFAWQDTDENVSLFKGPPNRATDFVPETAWDNSTTGMLRLDLIPVASGNITRTALVANARTYFLYPTGSAGAGTTTISYAAPSGEIVSATCNTNNRPGYCSVTFNGLGAFTQVYARVSAIYRPSVLSVTMTDSAPNPVGFRGAQIIVDSTGKANDVLRRIQARVSPTGDLLRPEWVLRSIDTLCKKFSVHVSPDDLRSNDTSVPADPTCNPNP